jgi:septal ring factor EnvC (AmiA/AmiB activator)
MSVILSLLSSKTTWLMIAAALLAIFIGSQQVRIAHLKSVVEKRDETIAAAKADIEATRALVTQWQDAYGTLMQTVDTQNTAIQKLEAEVAKRAARVKEVLRLADIARAEANGLADTIQLMEIAKDECTSMRQLIDAYTAGVQ